MHPDIVDAMVAEVEDRLNARIKALEDKLAASAADHINAMLYIAELEALLRKEGLL